MSWMEWIPVQDEHKVENNTVWLVSWAGSTGRATGRVAVWRDKRSFQGDDFGPGWVCYYTGTPLTDKISHVLPMPPRAGSTWRKGAEAVTPAEWHLREQRAFEQWWASRGDHKFSEPAHMAAGAAWFGRASHTPQEVPVAPHKDG